MSTIYKYDIVRSMKSGITNVLFVAKGTGEDRLLRGTLVGVPKKKMKLATATPNIVRCIDVDSGEWRSFDVSTVKYMGRADCKPRNKYRG